MSLMNQYEFEKKFFPFKLQVEYITEYKEKSFEVIIFRGATTRFLNILNGMIITPSFVFVSKNLWPLFENEEALWEWMKDLDVPFFQKNSKCRNPFDSYQLELELTKVNFSFTGNIRDVMIRVDMEPEAYFKMINKNNKMTSRFYPRESEERIYNFMFRNMNVEKIAFPNGFMERGNHKEMCTMCRKCSDEVRMFYEKTFLRTRMREEETDIMSIIDTRQLYETSVKYNLNTKNLKMWMKARHNMFGVSLLQEMDWEIPNKFDINLEESFNYFGMYSHKTPDYAYMDGETIVLVDFAVTKGNMLDVLDRKTTTYKPLVDDMMASLSVEVRLEVLIWAIDDKDSFYLSSKFENIREKLSENKIMKEIYTMHRRVKMMENYSLLSQDLDANYKDPSEDLTLKREDYMDLLSSLVEMYNLEGKRTYDVKDTRKDIKKKEMKKFKEMDIYPELKEVREEDGEKYLNHVKTEMISMLSEGVTPRSMKSIFTKDDRKINQLLTESLENQERVRKDLELKKNKLTKIFKFPYLDNLTDQNSFGGTPMLVNYEHETEDGTLFTNWTFQDDTEENLEFLHEGFGISDADDENFFDGLFEYFTQPVSTVKETINDFCPQLNGKFFYEELKRTRVWAVISFFEELAENISYMEGRRHVFNEKKGHTVMKGFEDYVLILRSGSRLTSNKQIRFKLMAKKDKAFYSESDLFHSWKEYDNDFMCSSWLTMSITDLQHFLKIKEVSMAMASDYYDKKVEMNKSHNMVETIMDRSFTFSLICLMEHRRGTSTTLQLNRYLLHSASSYITNREKLVDDINSSPIRSRLEGYIRLKQIKWYSHMLTKTNDINKDKLNKLMSTSTDYDRVYFPSFFDLNLTMEFGMMMNEMYLCNLFNKDSGFIDHRVKQIVSKMTQAEMMFQKVKLSEWSKGNIQNLREFWMEKDQLHMFDKRFVASATKRFFSNIMNQTMMLDAMTKSIMEIVDPAMMMTSSLTGGKYRSTVLEFKDKVTKTKSFLSLFEMLETMPTHLLVQMVSLEEVIEAIFTIFPKSQIGGPREILIQSVMLRVMVKFLETISYNMCEKHNKEMITKDKKKADIQSQTMSSMKDDLMMLKKKGVPSVFGSFNSDATKWSPGFVMEHFMHFVFNWETDDKLKDMLCTVVSSFSHKVILTPDILTEKWNRKPEDELEYDKAIQEFREKNKEGEGVTIQESGMGQGMFHKLSSLFHCIMDDTVDYFLKDILFKLNSVKLDQMSLISSDDKTKMFMMVFSDLNQADQAMENYIKIIDYTYRLANIHTNWKKSGLQFVIAEFNSLFSIGKRMCWATVKDLYTANAIPDLTSPEEAVKHMLSSIRRCFEHGVYLPTVETLMVMAHNQLKRYYRLDMKMVNSIMLKLNTNYKNLPYHLGFMPLDKMVETLTFGLDFHMFKASNSNELMDFYKGLHSAGSDFSVERSRSYIPFDESGTGKFWLELPMRLDKRLIEMKNMFYKDILKKTQEETIKSLNLNSINVNLSAQDFLNHTKFKESYFVGMNRKYEFQETMAVHSMVRALQMSKKKAMRYPLTKEQVEMQDTMHSETASLKEKEEAFQDFKMTSMGIDEFVDFCLSRKDNKNSLILMTEYQKMNQISDEVEQELKSMVKSLRMNHPIMRELRFNMEDFKSSFNKNDLVNYMFDKSADFKNSSMKAFSKMCLMFGVKDTKVWENPFKFMREIMTDKEYCYKTFMEFVDHQAKTTHNIRMRLLSDFPDSGNMKINLLNLYRSRSSPLFLLNHQKNSESSVEDVDFLTKMSFREWKGSSDKEMPKIKMEDRPVTRTRKLLKFGLNQKVKMNKVYSERLFYKKDVLRESIRYTWCDLSFLAVAEEYKSKGEKKIRISIMALDRNSVEDNNNFISVKRFLLENSDYEIEFLTKHRLSRDGSFLYSLERERLFFTMEASYGTMSYKVNMSLFYQKDNTSRFKASNIFMMEDNYSFSSDSLNSIRLDLPGQFSSTLLDCIINPPSPEILDQILLNNHWIKRDLFEIEDDQMDEAYRLADIRMINKQFSAEGLSSMIPNLLGLNLESEEDSEIISNNMNMVLDTNMITIVGNALKKAMESNDEDEVVTSLNASETTSIMMIVEKIVKSSSNEFLYMDSKKVKDMMSLARGRMASFHNMMLWCLKDIMPSLSDTMLLMIYNIKLKELSFNTYIGEVKDIRITNPPDSQKSILRHKNLFRRLSEEEKMENSDLLSYF